MAATNISDAFRSALRIVPSGDSSGASDELVQKKNLTYEQMLALLQMPTYDARDEETLRQVAQSMYAPQYNAEVEAAQQAQAKTNLSLENQLAALLTNVGAQRDELAQSVLSALSQQQQSALQRGMQRSSYNQAAQAGIQAQGVKLNDQISSNLLQQQSAIEAQRQQGAEQLAQTLSRLLVDRATNENNLMQQLRDQDYERGMRDADMLKRMQEIRAKQRGEMETGKRIGQGALEGAVDKEGYRRQQVDLEDQLKAAQAAYDGFVSRHEALRQKAYEALQEFLSNPGDEDAANRLKDFNEAVRKGLDSVFQSGRAVQDIKAKIGELKANFTNA
jgi:hypothetical protein